jgi:hypothetical protein
VLVAAAYIKGRVLSLPLQQQRQELLRRGTISSLLVVAMALMLAVLGMVLGLVMASSLLLRWNEVQYSRRRGLPPGTMGWPLFGENTEFLKQGPSFMRARRLRLVGFSWLTRTTWHFPSCPVSQRKSSACASPF